MRGTDAAALEYADPCSNGRNSDDAPGDSLALKVLADPSSRLGTTRAQLLLPEDRGDTPVEVYPSP